MGNYYQDLDRGHFDYHLEQVPGIEGPPFRGPLPDLDKPFFACIGGAQTFGRFCDDPYPSQLARALDLPCLNLGLGGAGPRYALAPAILDHLQRARFVVVQMFSGRSASNSRFDNSAGRNFGRVIGTNAWTSFEDFLSDLAAQGDLELLQRTVAETRADYAHHAMALANELRPPTLLLWLSRRTPDYEIGWQTPFQILSHYPQLIDRETVEKIRPAYDHYVECAGEEGIPQALWTSEQPLDGARLDDQGQLWNDYYPSPQMHTAAARLLLPVCQQI